MPYSHPAHYQTIVNFIKSNFKEDIKIIDIGCGSGTYKKLLPDYYMDGIEVYEKYIKEFDLKNKYNKIFNVNVVDFNFSSKYDLAIMGDILEHLSIYDAINVIHKINEKGIALIVQIPYQYEQGIYDGNINEIHLQSDLTHEIFLNRYSMFNFKYLTSDAICGVYYLN